VGDPAAPPERSREHYLVLAGAWLALFGLVGIGLALTPDPRGFGTHEQLGFQPCFPVRFWNIPCPGCGVTTAVALAFHGQPLASLRTQPFGWVTILTVAGFALFATRLHLARRDVFRELAHLPWRVLLPTGTVLLGGSWLYKLARMRGWLG